MHISVFYAAYLMHAYNRVFSLHIIRGLTMTNKYVNDTWEININEIHTLSFQKRNYEDRDINGIIKLFLKYRTGDSSEDEMDIVVKDYSIVVINHLLKLNSNTQYKYIISKSKYSKFTKSN